MNKPDSKGGFNFSIPGKFLTMKIGKKLSEKRIDYLREFLMVAPLSHALWRSVEAEAFRRINLKSPVLDVGCGFGEFTGVALSNIECGVDINEKDIKRAMKGKKYRKLLTCDARKLPFPNNTFQTVISVSVLEHITKCQEVLAEVYRVLAPGGSFIFTVVTDAIYDELLVPSLFRKIGFLSGAAGYCRLHSAIFHHVFLRPANWWESRAKKTGFRVVRKNGTVSARIVKLHEIFLLTAWPSQLWKYLTGRRLVILGMRAKILPIFFRNEVRIDQNCRVNMMYVLQKPGKRL